MNYDTKTKLLVILLLTWTALLLAFMRWEIYSWTKIIRELGLLGSGTPT